MPHAPECHRRSAPRAHRRAAEGPLVEVAGREGRPRPLTLGRDAPRIGTRPHEQFPQRRRVDLLGRPRGGHSRGTRIRRGGGKGGRGGAGGGRGRRGGRRAGSQLESGQGTWPALGLDESCKAFLPAQRAGRERSPGPLARCSPGRCDGDPPEPNRSRAAISSTEIHPEIRPEIRPAIHPEIHPRRRLPSSASPASSVWAVHATTRAARATPRWRRHRPRR